MYCLFHSVWEFVFGPCFCAVLILVSFLVLQSFRWGRDSWLLYFLLSCVCKCSESLPRGAVGSVLSLFLMVPWVVF